jgi:hypothetical protein
MNLMLKIVSAKRLLPLNRSRENAYAAGVPIIKEMIVAAPTTSTEFHTNDCMPWSLRTSWYVSLTTAQSNVSFGGT